MTTVAILKATGTYADTLQAVGAASALQEMTGLAAQIVDCGDRFDISIDGSGEGTNWSPPSPGFLYIWRSKKDGSKPRGTDVMDYEKEKELSEQIKKANASSRARRAVAEAVQEEQEFAPAVVHSEFRLAAIIESMRKGWMGDKELYAWVIDHQDEALAWCRDRFLGRSVEPRMEVSNSQILNPSTGKGVHASKTVATSPNAISKGVCDTFTDWMKLRGITTSMLPHRSDEDFKFFVIEPGDIRVSDLKQVRSDLQKWNLWGGLRLDIESGLRLLQVVVMRSDVNGGEISLRGRRPKSVIRGLRQAYFKSLGTAAALMNDALLPLPSWFEVNSRDDVEDYLQITNEPYGGYGIKYGPLSNFQKELSSDVPILQQYRRWMTTGELDDLLTFHVQFAIDLLPRLAAGEFATAFRVEILDLLLKKGYPKVTEIITSDGFLSVARAVRNTTIYAAGMKSSDREVRFGLAQKWKQRIKAGNESFLATLGEFVQEQNWEVVHKLEGRGHVVSAEDLNQVVRLVEKHGAELVGMLLLGYGFARAEKVTTDADKPGN
ncbi:MAG: hypothetical protein IT428_20485 [Planctomycetaceae bacterium]|nr:hypothetical protein [Planctomycetaceae bacterium]